MSRREEVVELLEEMARLLDLDGANSFRVSAHANAARALAKLDADFEILVADGRITDVDGIGKGIAEKIEQYCDTGAIAELDELRAKFPAGLLPLLKLSGFGPKKVRAVYTELGVDSAEALRAAIADGRVAKLKGFGRKTAENILASLELAERFTGQHRFDKALGPARELLSLLRAHPAVLQIEVCGSLRRCKEIVKDLDFVVATNDAAAVMHAFVTMDAVESAIGHGPTKSSVRLRQGIQADLRCVSPEQFPFAILHFTGSKEHNTRLRLLAREKGYKLNEYGLFPEGSEGSLPAASEADIYGLLGLAYIHPEIREDRGEVEAAAAGTLPRPLDDTDLRGLLHMHTHYSDGKPTVEDYARWALEHGISWMGIADHSQSLTVANGLRPDRVAEQQAEIDEVNQVYIPKGVRLLKGIESDILEDGALDYSDEVLATFDFIVASVHSHFNLTEARQTRRIIRAMENPHTTVLGHMTGRLILQRDGYAVDQREVLRQAGRLGVAIEINANPRRLDVDWRLIRYAMEVGCQLTIGPDAHILAGLDDTWYGVRMARKGWATPDRILNCGPVEDFLAFARRRKDPR